MSNIKTAILQPITQVRVVPGQTLPTKAGQFMVWNAQHKHDLSTTPDEYELSVAINLPQQITQALVTSTTAFFTVIVGMNHATLINVKTNQIYMVDLSLHPHNLPIVPSSGELVQFNEDLALAWFMDEFKVQLHSSVVMVGSGQHHHSGIQEATGNVFVTPTSLGVHELKLEILDTDQFTRYGNYIPLVKSFSK